MTATARQIQSDFQEFLLGDNPEQGPIIGQIAQRFGLKASERLAIYYHAYRLRLYEALGEAYEKTHGYIGDRQFAQLCADYVQTHPSQTRNLRWYGADFSEYLAQALPEHPAVAELAAFEWTLALAFDALDADVLQPAALAQISEEQWEELRLVPQPSLHILQTEWNSVAIWQALAQEQTPPEPLASPRTWLIWRREHAPQFRSLDPLEAQALRDLRQGRGFSAICEAATLAAGETDIGAQIGAWLQVWLTEGVLAGIALCGREGEDASADCVTA